MKKLVVLLWVCAEALAGGVQRWVDEAGQVHFGDVPPPHVQAQDYRVKERSRGDAADVERLQRQFGKAPWQAGAIEPGMRTHQAVALLGPPDRKDAQVGGAETWEYDRPGGVTTRLWINRGYVYKVTEAPTHERHIYQGVDQPAGAPPQAPIPAPPTP